MDYQTDSYIRELKAEIENLKSENEMLREKLNSISLIVNEPQVESMPEAPAEAVEESFDEVQAENDDKISVSNEFDNLKEELDSLKNLLMQY